MDVPTLHIVSYFPVTVAFKSLHKPNSFHAKYKSISSKCWLGRTEGRMDKEATICFPSLRSIKIVHYKKILYKVVYNKQKCQHYHTKKRVKQQLSTKRWSLFWVVLMAQYFSILLKNYDTRRGDRLFISVVKLK